MRFLDAKLAKTAHAAGPVLQSPGKAAYSAPHPIAGLDDRMSDGSAS